MRAQKKLLKSEEVIYVADEWLIAGLHDLTMPISMQPHQLFYAETSEGLIICILFATDWICTKTHQINR